MYRSIVAYVRQFDRSLWILSTGWFVGAFGFAASIPFIAIYFHSEFGMSIAEIGIFFGVMAVVRSVFEAIGGEAADRVEKRWLLVYSQYVRAFAFLMLAAAIQFEWGFWWIATFMLLNSIFGAVFRPAANALVSELVSEEKRLDGYAITRSAGNLGWAAGPALGGFLAVSSYSLLFAISCVLTFASGLVFHLLLNVSAENKQADRFKFSDLLAIRHDKMLAGHSVLIFMLYLVVSQLIAPFSVYAVEIVGLSETQLGYLYSINGLMVVFLQVPVTRLIGHYRLSSQIAIGALLYAIGYGMVGALASFGYFVAAIIVVTLGEIAMSPASLTLTSRLAPKGRTGRYMGIFGFFVASGWSFGPLYGGAVMELCGTNNVFAWGLISSLALASALGYWMLSRKLKPEQNAGQ